ncbi:MULTISPECIES: transposase [Streptomyces]|uniref:transposase n=1 Tax=Streptomyces lycopersici TaxID=2974589 RepID=UPI003524291C
MAGPARAATRRVAGGRPADFSRIAVDASHLRAVKGGARTGPSPVDRGRTGSKRHVIVDAHGIPLAATLTGEKPPRRHPAHAPGPRHLDGQRQSAGVPVDAPICCTPTAATTTDTYRRDPRGPGNPPVIARRGTEHGSGLGVHRWVVEAAFAPLHWFRRLRIRWEVCDDIHQAFITLGCAIICWRRLKPSL